MEIYIGADLEKQEKEYGKAKAIAIRILEQCAKDGLSIFAVEQIPTFLESTLKKYRTERALDTGFKIPQHFRAQTEQPELEPRQN